MARPVTMAATPKPSTGPVNCGFGTRHSVLTTTRAVSTSTNTLMPMRRAEGSSALRGEDSKRSAQGARDCRWR